MSDSYNAVPNLSKSCIKALSLILGNFANIIWGYATMWQLGEAPEKCTYLATIYD